MLRGGLTNEQMEVMGFFNIMNTTVLQQRYRALREKPEKTEREQEVMGKIMDEMINRGV